MKKRKICCILLVAALCGMAFAGCEKDDAVDISKYKTIITVKSSQSKTHYDSSDGSVLWDAGDKISVARGTTFADEPFTLIDTANGVARFGGDLSGVSSGSYFAIYPAQENLSINSQGVLTCNVIPTQQTLTEASFGNGNNTSVGWDASTSMRFRNVGALAKIAVKGHVAIKSIRITDNSGNPLSGRGTIDLTDDDLPIVWDESDTAHYVEATASNQTIGVSLSSPKWFYIVLPPCTLSDYTVTITDINNFQHVKRFTPSTPLTVERSHVVMLGAFVVITPAMKIEYTSFDDLSSVFGDPTKDFGATFNADLSFWDRATHKGVAVFNDTVTKIPVMGNGNIISIVIPVGVTEIAEEALYFSYRLSSVKILANITTLPNEAFGFCSNLVFIDLPATLQSFGSGFSIPLSTGEFLSTHNSYTIVCRAINPPTAGSVWFPDMGELVRSGVECHLYVPAESVKTYKNAYSITTEGIVAPIPDDLQ